MSVVKNINKIIFVFIKLYCFGHLDTDRRRSILNVRLRNVRSNLPSRRYAYIIYEIL